MPVSLGRSRPLLLVAAWIRAAGPGDGQLARLARLADRALRRVATRASASSCSAGNLAGPRSPG